MKEEPAVYNLASDPFLPLVYLEKQNDCKYSLFCRKEGVQTCKIDQNTETGKAFLITVRFKLQDIKFNCFKKHQSVVCVFSHWYSFDFPAEMCFFKCICHLLHRFFTEANLIFASSGLIVSLFHDFVFPYAWHGSPHVLWTVVWEVHMIVIPTIVGRDPLDWPQWLSFCWLQQMSWVVFKIYAGKHFFYTFFLPSQMMSCYVFFSLASTKDFLSAKSENNEVSILCLNGILYETTLQCAHFEEELNELSFLLPLPNICT